jgi:hypothetical protein
MRIKKFLFLACFLVLLMITSSARVNADIGPKPFVAIEISGMGEQTYTMTLISREAHGPNFFYEDYLEFHESWMEYHPIMEYVDSEGYRWIGWHKEMHGDGEFKWSYYPPQNFKILIMTEDNQIYTSAVLERYAFASYFRADVTDVVQGEAEAIKVIQTVEPDYHYSKEILTFLIRLVLTIAIEIGVALLFGFKGKELVVILLVNAVTQIILNVILNAVTYYSGQLAAVLLFILGEALVISVETVFYAFYFKTKSVKALLYGIIANLVSCGAGLGWYLLEQRFFGS